MKKLLRACLVGLAPLLTVAAAGTASAAPWYLGEFRSVAPHDSSGFELHVVCKPGERCAIDSTSKPGQPPSPVDVSNSPKAIPVDAPNNSLEDTRRTVADKPAWYKDPELGTMVTAMQKTLESRDEFVECYEIDGTGLFSVCSLATDPQASKTLVLLMITMNGSCGQLPFCAYYFLPLKRIR